MQLILTKLTNEATHADDSAASVAEKYLVGRLEELLRLEQSDAPDADSHSGD